MKHEPEFHKPAEKDPQPALDLAAAFARTFLGSDDGKRALADLRKRFGIGREVFVTRTDGRFDTIGAAKADGQRDVMRHIEDALRIGAPNFSSNNP